ncbi:hypothetical protein MOK15_00065 [Sphingobium sp. BYY-5]|uniref:hypothetical protein n=1 Tax=Sphingobium sp. BYY-5 TaxID=2926400 RepID=UPI001FA6CE1D|nr:hypothetical protein [Sphingobium sp. BYY-5]MCI4588503.1 hypothetical protein [Sphingobium sp. BYY-5]
MIELSQFIESVLFDISMGVAKAKVRAGDLAAIAPPLIDGKPVSEVTHVEFDIGVKTSSTDSSSSGAAGKIGVRARIFVTDASAELGGNKGKNVENRHEHNHRVLFKVPLHLTANYRNSPNLEVDAAVIAKVEQREALLGS